MNKNIFLLTSIVIALSFLTGCETTKVERVKTDTTIDLSGRWNDADARMVAEDMIKSCTKAPWLEEFSKKNSRAPVVIVGTVTNRSAEHIDSALFVKDLEQSLLNSGKVTFVASKEERLEVRDERQDQQKGLTDPTTIKPIGKETGADFILRGNISTAADELKGKSVTLYQVTLEMVDLTTNRVSWLGKTEVKKLVERGRFSF